MKSLFKALGALCIILTCTSCSWMPCIYDILGPGLPYIEGEKTKYFDSKAQKQSFRVFSSHCNRPYKYKRGWRIEGLRDGDSDKLLTSQIDTLANGNFRIAYDWVSFEIRDGMSVIDVEVSENTTGLTRSIYFDGLNSGGKPLWWGFTITQSAE